MPTSFKLPVLLFIFSPHCGHCVSVHPTWDNFTELYKDDPNIYLVKCNSQTNYDVCHQLYNYTAYPVFIEIINGKAFDFKPNRTIESFIDQTENVKKINLSLECRSFPAERGQFPSIIVHGDKSMSETCAYLQKIVPHLKDSLFVGEPAPKPYLQAYYGGNALVSSYVDVNKKSIEAFYNEYIPEPFGGWSIADGINKRRKLGFLIYDRWRPYFTNVAQYFADSYIFTSMTADYFNKYYNLNGQTLGQDQLPAMAITNKKQDKFFLVRKVENGDDFLFDALNDGVCKNLERNMTHSITPLLKKKRPHSRAKKSTNHKESASLRMKRPVWPIIAVGVVCMAVYFIYIIKFQTPKDD